MRIPFTNIEIRASEQRPRPDAWSDFWYGRSEYETKSGLDVNEDSALTLATVWACVRVISEDLASLPLFVYSRSGRNKIKVPDHPAYGLLHDAPNPEMSAMQWRECMQAHLLTFGNCYSEIQRDLRGRPMALWPLNPAKMTVERDENNRLSYEYRLEDGTEIDFRPEDILHVAGIGYNGLIGYSPIQYQREAIAIGLSAQEFQATSYKNGQRLQLAFTHPAPKAPNPEGRKQFRDEIRKEYGGRGGNAIGVLWEGMKAEVISQTFLDAQFVERLKLSVVDICRIFRVPPHKIMDLDRATFSNIEQQSISYVVDAVRPWAIRWEQAINSKLLGQGEFFCEHLIDAIMRGDISSRYAAYAVGRQWGWLSANDIRERENMNPLPGDEGDIYLSPSNMVPADQVGKEPEAASQPSNLVALAGGKGNGD